MVARRSCVLGRSIDPCTARKTISQVQGNGQFDGEEFPQLEPPDWRIGTRYSGTPVLQSPMPTIDLCSPDDPRSYRGPEDPLLRELTEEPTSQPWENSHGLFPPMKRTPHIGVSTMEEEGFPNEPTPSYPDTDNGHESPYLELHDDGQLEEDLRPTNTPECNDKEGIPDKKLPQNLESREAKQTPENP